MPNHSCGSTSPSLRLPSGRFKVVIVHISILSWFNMAFGHVIVDAPIICRNPR
jgi:hypothetical protein